MISHNGRFLLSSHEKDEIEKAIMLIPEQYQFADNTMIIVVGNKLRIKWGEDIWISNPGQELSIIGQTAYSLIEMLKSKELWRVNLVQFLLECYPELLQRWCPDREEKMHS